MADEEEDIKRFKRQIDELKDIRAKRTTNHRSFSSELENRIGNLGSGHPKSWQQSITFLLNAVGDAFSKALYYMVYWHPQYPLDDEAGSTLNELFRQGELSKNQWGQATWQRIIRRASDGRLEAVGPPKYAFPLAKIGIAILIVGGSFGIVKILEEPFNLLKILPWCFPLGAFLGLAGRMLYNFAWGHVELAKKLRHMYPILILRLD